MTAGTTSTTATTPGLVNSDLIKTDNTDASSDQHEGNPSPAESEEVRKSKLAPGINIRFPSF